MIGDVVAATYPTFAEVTEEWPELPIDHGRVVIYFPRQGLKSFNPYPFGIGGFVTISVSVDDILKTSLGDRTFVFADLTAGKHVVKFIGPGLRGDSTISIDVSAGDVLFIEVDQNYVANNTPHVVPKEHAMNALYTLHHNYRLSQPFHDLPPKARRAF
jgi:hypothetical protein